MCYFYAEMIVWNKEECIGLYITEYKNKFLCAGRKNKKGQEMRDLVIEPSEAELIRKIFRMTVDEGWENLYTIFPYLTIHRNRKP